MAVTGHQRGHLIQWNEDKDLWFYVDTGNPVSEDPDRPCGHCGLNNTPEGHDGCLGTLKGVMNACCGHGIKKEAYIMFSAMKRIGGAKALKWINNAIRKKKE